MHASILALSGASGGFHRKVASGRILAGWAAHWYVDRMFFLVVSDPDIFMLRYWILDRNSDWDNVTLLFQRPGQNGLECCANPRTGNPKEMYWTAVNPVEGGIAVNIGDMLARWSDGKLHSNLHRVRLPKDASKPRYSIAFFAQSDKKTMIESKENLPITAGDYILSRLNSNFAKTP